MMTTKVLAMMLMSVALVRSRDCPVLNNQDVVAPFDHIAGDGMTGLKFDSDQGCSQKCTSIPECTAWVRQPSTGLCWLTKQQAVTFESKTDRNSGRRCAEGSYSKITSGTCASVGMTPITSLEECNTAAKAVGLTGRSADVLVNATPRPEGCYDNGKLFLSTNKANVGLGADSSRHPICKSGPAPPTTTVVPTTTQASPQSGLQYSFVGNGCCRGGTNTRAASGIGSMTRAQCRGRCTVEAGCTAFETNGCLRSADCSGPCWLFYMIDSASAPIRADPCVSTGDQKCYRRQGGYQERANDCSGNNILFLSGKDKAACEKECDGNPACKGFSRSGDGNSCIMKNKSCSVAEEAQNGWKFWCKKPCGGGSGGGTGGEDATKATDPETKGQWAVVWHVMDHAEGEIFSDEKSARDKYGQISTQWARILYNKDLKELERYGGMSRSGWTQLKRWAQKNIRVQPPATSFKFTDTDGDNIELTRTSEGLRINVNNGQSTGNGKYDYDPSTGRFIGDNGGGGFMSTVPQGLRQELEEFLRTRTQKKKNGEEKPDL